VDISNVDETVSKSNIDKVVSKIITMDKIYNKIIGDVRMSFITETANKIVLRFDGYCNGQYYWYKGKDPKYAVAFNNGISNFQFKDVKVKDSTGKELVISSSANDCERITSKDAEGHEYTSKVIAYYSINLQDSLADSQTYTLEIGPTLLMKNIDTNLSGLGGLDSLNGVADRNAVLPAMSVTFVKNSAKEYVYQGETDNSVMGVAILGDPLYSWSDGELYAIPYDKSGLPEDFNYKEMKWSVLSGDASIVDTGKYNQIKFNSVGTIVIKVEYKGFSDTKTVYYNAQQSI
jgi:hypothetical protein